MNHGKVNYYEKAELLRECTIRDYEKVFFHETEKVRNTKRNMRNIVHNVSLHVMEEKSVWAWRKKKKKKKKGEAAHRVSNIVWLAEGKKFNRPGLNRIIIRFVFDVGYSYDHENLNAMKMKRKICLKSVFISPIHHIHQIQRFSSSRDH